MQVRELREIKVAVAQELQLQVLAINGLSLDLAQTPALGRVLDPPHPQGPSGHPPQGTPDFHSEETWNREAFAPTSNEAAAFDILGCIL